MKQPRKVKYKKPPLEPFYLAIKWFVFERLDFILAIPIT